MTALDLIEFKQTQAGKNLASIGATDTEIMDLHDMLAPGCDFSQFARIVMRIGERIFPTAIKDKPCPDTSSVRPGAVIRLKISNADGKYRYRFWRVKGFHLGGTNADDLIELESLDTEPGSAHGIRREITFVSSAFIYNPNITVF